MCIRDRINAVSFPTQLDGESLRHWFGDSDNVAGFLFLCFVSALVGIGAVSISIGIYYLIFTPQPLKQRPSTWISIIDYQDKLNDRQRDIYLKYSCELFEREVAEAKALQLRREREENSGRMFPPKKKSSVLDRLIHIFSPSKRFPLQKIHDSALSLCDTEEPEEKERQLEHESDAYV